MGRHITPGQGTALLAIPLLVAAALATGPVIQVSREPGTYASLSPNGNRLLFTRRADDRLQLYVQDLSSGAILQLTHGSADHSAGAWALDGSRVVFQRDDSTGRDLWIVGADGRGARNITNTPSIAEQHPRFADTAGSIVFDSNRDDRREFIERDSALQENYEIYVMPAGDSVPIRLTAHGGWDMYGAPSPGFTHLAWRRAVPTGSRPPVDFDIFVKDQRTGEVWNMTRAPGHDANPSWSPNAQWIAFVSARDGGTNVYVARPDGSGLRQLTDAKGRDLAFSRPSFAPDGKSIVATRSRGGSSDIVRIIID